MSLDEQFLALLTFCQQIDQLGQLFVVGAQRSGTTWLRNILDAHPAICCLQEVRLVDTLMVGLFGALGTYNEKIAAYGKNTARAYSDEDRMAVLRLLFFLQFRGRDLAGLRYIGEKTPENAMAIQTLAKVFPRARFPYIVRDGRDACVSAWYQYRSLYQAELSLAGFLEQWVPNNWALYNGNLLQFMADRPDSVFLVRYEDLWANPATVVASLLRFLDVDADSKRIEACLAAADFAVVSGGRKRGDEDPRAFYRKGVIGDWRQHFGEAESAMFEACGGRLNRMLGYG